MILDYSLVCILYCVQLKYCTVQSSVLVVQYCMCAKVLEYNVRVLHLLYGAIASTSTVGDALTMCMEWSYTVECSFSQLPNRFDQEFDFLSSNICSTSPRTSSAVPLLARCDVLLVHFSGGGLLITVTEYNMCLQIGITFMYAVITHQAPFCYSFFFRSK